MHSRASLLALVLLALPLAVCSLEDVEVEELDTGLDEGTEIDECSVQRTNGGYPSCVCEGEPAVPEACGCVFNPPLTCTCDGQSYPWQVCVPGS